MQRTDHHHRRARGYNATDGTPWQIKRNTPEADYTGSKPTPVSDDEQRESDPDHSSEPALWTKQLIDKLEWKRFEDVCVQYFLELGYQATTTGIGADGGIDFKIHDHTGTNLLYLGQCKAWQGHNPVGVEQVRAFYGVMKAQQVNHGIYMTSSRYTDAASAWANNLPSQDTLALIDGNRFLERIISMPLHQQRALYAFATEGDYTTPTCPNCGIKMTRRQAKKGDYAGKLFWGCMNYPRCKCILKYVGETIKPSVSRGRRKASTGIDALIDKLKLIPALIIMAIIIWSMVLFDNTDAGSNTMPESVKHIPSDGSILTPPVRRYERNRRE